MKPLEHINLKSGISDEIVEINCFGDFYCSFSSKGNQEPLRHHYIHFVQEVWISVNKDFCKPNLLLTLHTNCGGGRGAGHRQVFRFAHCDGDGAVGVESGDRAGGVARALAVKLGDLGELTDRTGTLVVVRLKALEAQALGGLKPVLLEIKTGCEVFWQHKPDCCS